MWAMSKSIQFWVLAKLLKDVETRHKMVFHNRIYVDSSLSVIILNAGTNKEELIAHEIRIVFL